MNTIVQNDTAPKTVLPRRSRFPGKESGSVSFNLTAIGRQLLKDQASEAKVSNGDYVEMLIRERDGLPSIKISSQAKQTGPKGGAKSYFFGKNRGTTTAVCVTPVAHKMLDAQVAEAKMSRGDYVEYLLRLKGNMLDETLKSCGNEVEEGSMNVVTTMEITTMTQESPTPCNTEEECAPCEMDPQPETRPMPSTPTSNSTVNSFFTQNW